MRDAIPGQATVLRVPVLPSASPVFPIGAGMGPRANHESRAASVPWSKRTDVLLRPDEVRIARRGMQLFSRAGRTRRFAVVREGRHGGNGGDPWQSSVDQLSEALLEAGVRGGALHVVLSDHFVRYLLVPWSEKLVADSERLALARLMLGEVYGGVAEGWEVCLDDQPAGQPSFACAVDRTLLQALRELCKQRDLRLASLVPSLVARVNRHRKALRERAFCLASVEPGRLTLAFRAAAGWTAVRSRRSDVPVTEALPAALKQESAAGGATSLGALYVIGEDLAQLPPLAIAGWKITHLSENAPPAAVVPTLAQASEAQ